MQGKHLEAIGEYQKARQIEGGIAEPLAALGRAYALEGKDREARKVLDQLKELSSHSYVPPYNIAMIYAALGQREEALAALDKAYEERSWYPVLLAVDPKFDDLRSNPHFQQLVRRIGLPP